MNKCSLLLVLFLTACTTPQTVLRKSNDYATCGGSSVGSVAGGYIGYSIQKDHDEACVKEYTAKGYSIVKQ